MILRGKKLGFTLSEIRDLIGGKGATETPELEEQLQPQQILNQINHLERQRDDIENAIKQLRATHLRQSQGAACLTKARATAADNDRTVLILAADHAHVGVPVVVPALWVREGARPSLTT